MKTVSKLIVALGFVGASLSAIAAFAPGMSLGQIDSEVSKRLSNGASLGVIAADAKAANLSGSFLVSSLLSQGQSPASVVAALVGARFDAKSIVDSAVASGANRKQMVEAAILGGADPQLFNDSTAAGGDTGGIGFTPGGSVGFGGAPAPSFGGGGGGGVTQASRS